MFFYLFFVIMINFGFGFWVVMVVGMGLKGLKEVIFGLKFVCGLVKGLIELVSENFFEEDEVEFEEELWNLLVDVKLLLNVISD